MSEVNVTSSNWSSGAGVVDSYNSLITGIKNAHDEDKGVAAAEIGVAAVSTVIDTVAFALNPLSKLIAAGLGWLIEHVEFLRKPFDILAGNPDGIKSLADSLHKIAQDLRNTATDMGDTMDSTLQSWTGQAADNYKKTLGDRQSDIDGAGHSVDIAGYVVETTMALISAVRALIRDMITSTLGDIIATMLVALASAPFTFGASIAVGVGKCVVEGVAKVAEMMSKLAKLLGFAGRTAKRLDDLVNVLKKTAANLGGKYNNLRGIKPPATDTPPTTHPADDPPTAHPGDDATSTTSHDDPADDGNSTTGHDDTSDDGNSVYHDAQEDPSDDTTSTASHDDTSDDGNSVYHDAQENPSDDAASTTSTASHEEPADDTASTTGSTGHDEPADDTTTHPSDDASTHDDAAGTHDDAAGATPPKKSDPESLLKPYDHPNLKLHEDWLKKIGFGDELKTTKFNENWLKDHNPQLFTALKTISDLKSSKNMVGLTDKYITQLVKQLADIHERAKMSWDQANQQWQQDHPSATAGE